MLASSAAVRQTHDSRNREADAHRNGTEHGAIRAVQELMAGRISFLRSGRIAGSAMRPECPSHRPPARPRRGAGSHRLTPTHTATGETTARFAPCRKITAGRISFLRSGHIADSAMSPGRPPHRPPARPRRGPGSHRLTPAHTATGETTARFAPWRINGRSR